MRKVLTLLLFAFSFSLKGANAFFDFKTVVHGSPYNAELKLIPTNAPAIKSGSMVLKNSYSARTDTNGQCTVTNLAPLTYDALVTTKDGYTTPFRIQFTNDLGDPSTVNFTNLIVVSTNVSPGLSAYPTTVSDARFYPLTSNPSHFATSSITNGLVPLVNSGTTNVGLLAYNVYHTNFVINPSPIVITGSTVSGVNGTYTLSSSNFVNDLPLMIWTNGLANNKIIYLNDPGVNVFGSPVVLETGPNDASFLYSGSTVSDYIPAPGGWVPFTAPGGDVLVETLTTNAVITSLQALTPTNATFISTSTNIWVDPVNGNDLFATRTNRFPFQTIYAACQVATNGDTINLTTATYTESTVIIMPNGVILRGNDSVISNPFTFTDNDEVYGVRKFASAPHFNITNSSSRSIFKFGIATGPSGDGIDVDSANGLVQFWNMDNGSYWDAGVMAGFKSNAVVELYNCRQASVFQSGIGNIVQGSHALTWYVDGNGGKLRLYGGSLTVLNATNLTFTGPYGNNNSCFSIVNPNGQTNIGNASVEIYGTVIAHGTTNAGVWVTAITNSLNVPFKGYYVDSQIGSSLASPNVTNTLVFLDPVSGNGSGWTALNASSLASGTVPDARFPATLPAASGANLTALSGANIIAGTVNSNALDAPTKAQLALAAAPITPSYYPAPFLPGSGYNRGWLVQREYPNGAGLGVLGITTIVPSGTITASTPAAGLPLGTQYSVAAGGVYGLNSALSTEVWSTNNMITSWLVSFTGDVSSNRLWVNFSSIATAAVEAPFRTYGFEKPSTNANWFAYSNDSTVTNAVNTGVAAAIGTVYEFVIAKTNTTLTYYLNGAQVGVNTWNPTPLAIRHSWNGNALNSQASGIILHDYYNQLIP